MDFDSPFPIPWHWIWQTYEELTAKESSGFGYYRSPSLISPDGKYAAYSRLQMKTEAETDGIRVTSVMFVENLDTGDLHTIAPSSPLAEIAFDLRDEESVPGAMAILIPASWSENSDRILSRQFEGIFASSDATDYGVIWDLRSNTTSTIIPTAVPYTHTILLGWSENDPEQVLFRAGILGEEEEWPIWSVNHRGQTILASNNDRAMIFGILKAEN